MSLIYRRQQKSNQAVLMSLYQRVLGFSKKILSYRMCYSLLLLSIAAIIRSYLYTHFNQFSNDDVTYLNLATQLDGIGLTPPYFKSIHTHFPPGYPAVIHIFNSLGYSLSSLRLIETIAYPVITGILVLKTIRNYRSDIPIYASILAAFTPAFVLQPVIDTYASEYLFSLLAILSIYLFSTSCLRISAVRLGIASLMISFSYMVRPEGIVYILLFVPYSFWLVNRYGFRKTFKFMAPVVLPPIVFIIPYIIYLHQNLGRLTLSGKDTAADYIISQMYPNQTGLSLLAAKLGSVFDVFFLSPLFSGVTPLVALAFSIPLLVLLLKRAELVKLRPESPAFLVVSLLLVIAIHVIAYMYRNPLGRSIYPLLYLFVIIGPVAAAQLQGYCRPWRRFDILMSAFVCFFTLVFVLIYPFATQVPAKVPVEYNGFIKLIKDNKHLEIYSRSSSVAVERENIGVCTDINDRCFNTVDYAILSNSTWINLTDLRDLELQLLATDGYNTGSRSCALLHTKTTGNLKYSIYKCHE